MPLHSRRSWPYTATALLGAQAFKEIRHGEQVLGAKHRAPGRHHDERVGHVDVGPARRQRIDTLVIRLAEEHPVLSPGVGEADQLVLLALQGVERMSDTEPLPIAAGVSS